jgi:hypothetical protein
MPVYFAGRSESMMWVAAAALITALAGTLSRACRLMVVVPWVTIGMVTCVLWLVSLPARSEPPGIQIGRYLASVVETGDVIVIAGLWQLEVEHGFAAAELELDVPEEEVPLVQTFPKSQSRHPGWLDIAAFERVDRLTEEARSLELLVRTSGGRIWLVRSPGLPSENVWSTRFKDWLRTGKFVSQRLVLELILPPATPE